MDDELAHADRDIGGETWDAVCADDRNGLTPTPVFYLGIANAPWVWEHPEAPENDCRD